MMQYNELQVFIELKPDESSDPFSDPWSSELSPEEHEISVRSWSKKTGRCRGTARELCHRDVGLTTPYESIFDLYR